MGFKARRAAHHSMQHRSELTATASSSQRKKATGDVIQS
jgi:hypothetical protein